MSSLENAITAHIDIYGKRFEILVDPDLAWLYRTGKKADMLNILVVDEIFENARKGERHKEEDLRKAFGTTDATEIASQILERGEIQLTTEQKRKLLEEKRKKIVAILARECIDPRTGAPHPPQRIEKAMEEARVGVDAFKDAEAQIDAVLKELRPLLPLKFEKVRVAVRVPAEFAPKAYGALKEYGIKQEEWQSDGGIIVVVEMPAGMQADFYDRINKITGGNVQTKIVKK